MKLRGYRAYSCSTIGRFSARLGTNIESHYAAQCRSREIQPRTRACVVLLRGYSYLFARLTCLRFLSQHLSLPRSKRRREHRCLGLNLSSFIVVMTAKGKKRALDEFEVSEMQVSKCAKVHGLVTCLSPMKSNTAGTTKYFQGQLSDEKRSCRVVGFDTKVHRKLQEFRETKQPVAVDNCEVKEGRGGGGLEVVIRNSSAVQKSPSKYSVTDTVFSSCGAEVSLSDSQF